jgi:hypothetical protein
MPALEKNDLFSIKIPQVCRTLIVLKFLKSTTCTVPVLSAIYIVMKPFLLPCLSLVYDILSVTKSVLPSLDNLSKLSRKE